VGYPNDPDVPPSKSRRDDQVVFSEATNDIVLNLQHTLRGIKAPPLTTDVSAQSRNRFRVANDFEVVAAACCKFFGDGGSQEETFSKTWYPHLRPLTGAMTRHTPFTAVRLPGRAAGDRFCSERLDSGWHNALCRYAVKGCEIAEGHFVGRRQSERPEWCVSLPPAVTSPKHRVKEGKHAGNHTWIQTGNKHLIVEFNSG
jgi:hypothetical protein